MNVPFWWLRSLCTEHIRSVHDMHRVTTGYLFKVTMYTAQIEATFCWLVSWSTNRIRSVKLEMACFHMLCILLNVLAHLLWVQFSKSTLFRVYMRKNTARFWVFLAKQNTLGDASRKGNGIKKSEKITKTTPLITSCYPISKRKIFL